MKKENSALKAGLGYTIGNILIKGINILALPLFSRLMTTEEFGIYNVFVAYDSILFVIVGMALHSSIKSANVEFKGKIDEYVSSISLIYIINAMGLFLIVTCFGKRISDILEFENIVLYMLIILSTGNAILTLYNEKISLEYDYKKYLWIALFNSIGNVLCSIFLILTIFRSRRDLGRILGVTITIGVLALIILVRFYRIAKPRINKIYWKFGLKYSSPIVPHGISQVLLTQFDRVMIRDMVSNTAAGIYSLAGNVRMISTVITSSIATAWTTWVYSEFEKKNYKLIQKRAVQLGCVFVIMTIGLISLAPEIVLIFGGKSYDMAKYVAIPMLLDSFLLFIYNIIIAGEYYSKKTLYIMFGTIFAAILSIGANYYVLPKFGYVASAYKTLAIYFIYVVFHIIICGKIMKFQIFPLRWVFFYLFIVCGVALFNVYFINIPMIRWSVGFCIVIILSIFLIRDTGILKEWKS